MTKHELVGSTTASPDGCEGSIHMKEIKCNGTHHIVEYGANYCSHCGEEL